MNEETIIELPEEIPDLAAAYPELAQLKAANEALRERGQHWLFSTFEKIAQPNPNFQIGQQAWQFEVDRNVMIGARMGIRFRDQTLTIEVGWPREQSHGIVPDLGLARARVSRSPNVTIDANLLDVLTLRKEKDSDEVNWYKLKNNQVGEKITEEILQGYLAKLAVM